MKNRLTIITILAASLMMLLSGCDPTREMDGKQVRFTARSRGFISTKTSYSSIVDTVENGVTKYYQRINWESGDVIRIYSPKDEGNLWSPNMALEATNVIDGNPYIKLVYSDYALNTISHSGRYSLAKLYNNGDNGLTWTGNPATFYGAYPANRDDRLVPHAYDISAAEQHLLMEIKIPNAQTGNSTDVKTMPLLAKQGPVNSGNKVELGFDPYFSAYEFNLNSIDETITIDTLTLTAQTGYISGHYYWDLTAGRPEPDLGTPNKPADDTLTVIGNWQIKPATSSSAAVPANITIFGLPNNLSGISIVISFTLADGTTKGKAKLGPLMKDGSLVVFGARQKTRIKGLKIGGFWKILIEAVEVDEWQEVGTATIIL